MSIFSFPTISATLTLPHTPLHLFFFNTNSAHIIFFLYLCSVK